MTNSDLLLMLLCGVFFLWFSMRILKVIIFFLVFLLLFYTSETPISTEETGRVSLIFILMIMYYSFIRLTGRK